MSIIERVVEYIKNRGDLTSPYGSINHIDVFTQERDDVYNCLLNLNDLNTLNNFAMDIKEQLSDQNTTICKMMIGKTRDNGSNDGYIIFCYKGYYVYVQSERCYYSIAERRFRVNIEFLRDLQTANSRIEYHETDYDSEDDDSSDYD
jgi:hypothetical protein